MEFDSSSFIVFLPIVFGAYWLLSGRTWLQNLLLALSSYVFYGWWDWRFCFLMAFSSATAYIAAIVAAPPGRDQQEKERNGTSISHLLASECILRRKIAVFTCCAANLAILGFFKYWGFFANEAARLLSSFGFETEMTSLKVILPVGISFYTFQAIGYAIDAYRGSTKPVKDPVVFFAFISFFPQLVAGPIERASNILPQFLSKKTFNYPLAVDGCRQMLWGFFKKLVLADCCALAANNLLDQNGVSASSVSLAAGLICFAFQIYGDFSGYSDIAIGCGKLFGISLMRNFAFPYFARDIAEFWRRWHRSLTTWFRDYLYIPLGGSRCGMLKKIRNTFAIFSISGLWHGANWTFILWGIFHAACFLPLLICGKNRKHTDTIAGENRILPSLTDFARIASTFLLVTTGWAFFRAKSASQAFFWIKRIFFDFDFRISTISHAGFAHASVWISAVICCEWFNRRNSYGFARYPKSIFARYAIYMILMTIMLFNFSPRQTFIYFRF